jgi:hypothetical protein
MDNVGGYGQEVDIGGGLLQSAGNVAYKWTRNRDGMINRGGFEAVRAELSDKLGPSLDTVNPYIQHLLQQNVRRIQSHFLFYKNKK